MKFTCSQSELNLNLSLVSRAVPSSPTNPILGNVLLTADAKTKRVSLTAFDLSLCIYTTFPASVERGGAVTLPAKLLNDIVSRLPEGEITLLSDSDGEEEDSLTTLTSTSGRFLIRGIGAQQFPELPSVESSNSLVLPVSTLREGLRGALFAASSEEAKQILTGVHLYRALEGLEFAATDGHRLAVVETVDQAEADAPAVADDELAVTLPAKALRELERMLAMRQASDPVSLHFDDSQAVFELGEQRLTSRILEGAYPAYRQLIPKQFSRAMTVERKRLLSSLELVAVLADQKNHLVKFSLDSSNGQLYLSVDATDVGSAKELVPAQIRGESIEIAFNVRYLMDGLKALSANDIQMQLNESNQPVIFTPLDGVKMTYLVMPVQVRS